MIHRLATRLQKKRRRALPWHQKKWAHWKPGWGTVSAVTAVCALLFTGTQSWLTRISNQRDARSWVVLEKLELLPLQAERRIVIQSTLKNVGRTPAVNVRHGIYTKVVDIPEKLRNGQHDLQPQTISELTSGYEGQFIWRNLGPQAPGIPYLSLTSPDHAPLAQVDIDEFNSWNKVLILRERLLYEDAFGHEHQTDICYYTMPLESGENVLTQCPADNHIT